MKRLFTKREKVILFFTVAVIIFSIGFNFLISPVLKKNELLNKEINITRVKLSKYWRLLNQKEFIQNKYNKFSSASKLTEQQQDTLMAALTELENLAKDANIHIIDIRPESSKSVALYKEILINLKTEGTIEGYLKFIYDIENSFLLLRIKKFQLSSKPNIQELEGSFYILQLSIPE